MIVTSTEHETEASTDTSRTEWVRAARLWAVVLAFTAVAVARSLQVDVPFRDPHHAWFLGRIVKTLVLFVVLVLVDSVVRSGWPVRPARVWQTLRGRWTPARVALIWVALLAYHATYLVYHNLKSWDVFNSPRDQMLLDWDRWLFFGHSPAVLLHDLLGEHTAAHVLLTWYELFPPLVTLAFPAAAVLSSRVRDAYAGIAALVWVWILGTASYYLIPSLGPFHSAPEEFTGLPHLSFKTTQATYIAQRDYLLTNPHAGDAVAQVSAFASLHVGVTATILGLAWWHRLRRTTIVLSVFLVGTMLATVYLGWHFAVDVPAGLAIAALAWILGPLTVGVRHRPPPRQ